MDPAEPPDQPSDGSSGPLEAETGQGTLDEDRDSAGDREPDHEDYVPVLVSSDTGDEAVPDTDRGLGRKFEQFMQHKQEGESQIDEAKINLLPATLRPPIAKVVKKIERWTRRNPAGPALTALQELTDRLSDFLELQAHRDDHDYEVRCRDLLRLIYQGTIAIQKMTRRLKDAAIPRALAEYD